MKKQDTIYEVEILGTGAEFEAVHAELDRFPHLPLPGASYLVSGEEARDALLAHHGRGDAAISVSRATSNTADVLAPASVIAAFISHVGRHMDLAFHWDEEAHLWCLSSTWQGNYAESDDAEADSEEEAAQAALTYLLIDQDETEDMVNWPVDLGVDA